MTANLNPYLTFRDQARPAMEFYQSVFGGTLDLNTFEQLHAADDPAEKDKIMHSLLTGDKGIVFMAADMPNSMDYSPGNNMSMSLSGDDESTLRGYFDKLSDGGSDVMPMNTAPWGDTFGMCVDKFGIRWMVNVAGVPS